MNTISLEAMLEFCAEIDPLLVVLAKLTVLLFIAWVGHWLMLPVNPRWRVLLWRSAAVGLLLVPVFHAAMPAVPVSFSAAVVLPDDRSTEMASETGNSSATKSISATSSLPAGEDVFAHGPPLAHAANESLMSLRTLLIVIWIAGCLFCLLRIASGMWFVRRLIAQSDAVSEAVQEKFQRTRATVLTDEHVSVRVSSGITAPILCGVVRPTVLIPVGLAVDARGDHLPAVFAHELAHVKSRDLFWNLVVHTFSTVLWFHPLAWFARAAHAAGCEAVSDAIAVDYVGDVKVYGRTLAQVALDATAGPPILSLAMARSSGIGRRLQALERNVFAGDLSLRIVSAALVGCLAVVTAIGGVKVVVADEPITQETKAKPVAEESAEDKPTPADAAVDKALKFLVARQ